jgi:hypothetical protein
LTDRGATERNDEVLADSRQVVSVVALQISAAGGSGTAITATKTCVTGKDTVQLGRISS